MEMHNTDLTAFAVGYMLALLWSSTVTDSHGEDVQADSFELSEAAKAACLETCKAFMSANREDVNAAAMSYGMSHAGHDLALTRNGHGAGYWDGALPADLGQRLSDAARALGEVNLFLNMSGEVELS